ncbi:bifunctional 2-C-methyl-D-erythritol 4-phosphate cytidylyltransferase/2-C-methyl-D-erythritol 2,4-cyclodiphosphate synthase [Pseudorhodobacter sp. MZDSW-24AT]|uniref:bifunctional 2-C-methyl-D-erythritol 4-phosphate cytidylyltransferase/2-C-methyl-D-erythritol 2,4-cyclodiphosphate synthase n=1 Tax=Pseudorhodobacter sp. MZDSW-24AT TaxID=2052957 RepID=UPI000C1EA898|nr:bifunctional 2-C-methyl-D-erythritol 4-phosphate cytidylyltransferase/2-C-methyl-D-erythritol 2,4-cyclodiphosphate synthase [Pseudorhodobacter sp. MZDSW-24AT]PJF10827.1 bifunctional 2-C-methyl-D-erythritol 4-phosphate cytidylyltransferase/2-C-methyl-D-erythritol 2,4-cyclodiphosphate synthase [Pseudorhodobacter sp. MZDSW-24AT]
MTTAAIIVAAGRGTRAGGDLPKQWQDLAGAPVLAHTIRAFAGQVDRVVLVIHPEDRARAAGFGLPMVDGSDTRAGSVRNALEWLDGQGVTKVLIHDGARPLVSPQVIGAVLAALDDTVGAAPALPVTDALWRGDTVVEATASRDGLWRAQTPQGFRFDAIRDAHRAHPGGAADDVEVARWAGHAVAIVPGDEDNLKLTYPGDFARADRILKGRKMEIRLGNGYDVHAFTEGDGVWLCGVLVPHGRALLGHSDADVGMHALTDAIYGALAEGDIGVHFPPSDPQWKGAASQIFLRHAMGRVAARGYRLANCDVTLVCERPKIGPHQGAMRAALAEIMGVEVERISVKATTSERLGFTGREEGIAALATCALVHA